MKRSKIKELKEELFNAQQALLGEGIRYMELEYKRVELERIAKANENHKVAQMLEALEAAIEWIEDDRADDDTIAEQWYWKAVDAIKATKEVEGGDDVKRSALVVGDK